MIEIDQPQNNFSLNLNYEPQPALMPVIFQWIRELPQESNTIIDLAAGYGIEAQELARQGIICVCQDASSAMIQNAVMPVKYGQAESLVQYPDHEFSGALLKDTWVFLSPKQRQQMLQQLNRILTQKGSLLIISETFPEFAIDYLPSGLHATNHATSKCPTIKSLYDEYHRLLKENVTIKQIIYKSTPQNTQAVARKNHYNFNFILKYSENDTFANESRWLKRAGFIAKLTKLS